MWSESMDQHLQIFRGMPIWIVLFLLRKRTRSNCSNSDVKSFVSNSLPLTLHPFYFLVWQQQQPASLFWRSIRRREALFLCFCSHKSCTGAGYLLGQGSSWDEYADTLDGGGERRWVASPRKQYVSSSSSAYMLHEPRRAAFNHLRHPQGRQAFHIKHPFPVNWSKLQQASRQLVIYKPVISPKSMRARRISRCPSLFSHRIIIWTTLDTPAHKSYVLIVTVTGLNYL